jgi:hypothetical protein
MIKERGPFTKKRSDDPGILLYDCIIDFLDLPVQITDRRSEEEARRHPGIIYDALPTG